MRITRDTNERRNMKTPEEVIAKLEDAKNGIYSTAELESIWVPNEMLPESYHDQREGGTSLARLDKTLDAKKSKDKYVDPSSVSIKFYKNRSVLSGTPERLSNVKKYSEGASSEDRIEYNINSYKLDRNMRTFATLMNIDIEE